MFSHVILHNILQVILLRKVRKCNRFFCKQTYWSYFYELKA